MILRLSFYPFSGKLRAHDAYNTVLPPTLGQSGGGQARTIYIKIGRNKGIPVMLKNNDAEFSVPS